jgi:hypothetical protein
LPACGVVIIDPAHYGPHSLMWVWIMLSRLINLQKSAPPVTSRGWNADHATPWLASIDHLTIQATCMHPVQTSYEQQLKKKFEML